MRPLRVYPLSNFFDDVLNNASLLLILELRLIAKLLLIETILNNFLLIMRIANHIDFLKPKQNFFNQILFLNLISGECWDHRIFILVLIINNFLVKCGLRSFFVWGHEQRIRFTQSWVVFWLTLLGVMINLKLIYGLLKSRRRFFVLTTFINTHLSLLLKLWGQNHIVEVYFRGEPSLSLGLFLRSPEVVLGASELGEPELVRRVERIIELDLAF